MKWSERRKPSSMKSRASFLSEIQSRAKELVVAVALGPLPSPSPAQLPRPIDIAFPYLKRGPNLPMRAKILVEAQRPIIDEAPALRNKMNINYPAFCNKMKSKRE